MKQFLDFEKFKTEMVSIQENISNLKKASKAELNKLKSLENDLNDELNMFYNEKILDWSELVNFSSLEFVPARIKSKHSGQCKEVKQFFDFVHQSGGHENGWRKDDHLLFLKIRGRYKKINDVAMYLHEMLPDISIEDIKLHEEWYKKYLNLQSKKKEAINKWKQNKNNNEKHFKLANDYIETEEKQQVEQQIEKQKMFYKIEKERLRKQQQIEIKKIVNEWRESKTLFEQSKRHQQRIYEDLEKRRRATNANKLIKQFQSMDELHVEKMREIHKKQTEKPKKRIQSGPPVTRDPERLMKPTAQWAQRVRALREPWQGPLPIFATPKLAIPEWRKSIL
ncbi:unnamed protein product [Ceutorhynchus assimilis]|uniref:Coiled-coil domain containing 112 n=1 Tax=Ceutorhynchus assimilis TaxID=467358 RepID=A0A9N9N0L9_9CUCU|nr:unnamed protein product [Ceutorhynchus assimilis]